MDTAEFKDVGIMRNPYEEAFAQYEYRPKPYYHQRQYLKPIIVRRQQPERYNASRDLNETARTVVGGAVVIGTLGLFGSLLNR